MSHHALADAYDPQPASAPYAHRDFVHPSSGDRLRIIPERGGLVSGWSCGGREILHLIGPLHRSQQVRGGIPVLFPICGNFPVTCSLSMVSTTPQAARLARDLPWQLQLLEDQGGVCPSLSSTTKR